MTQEEIQAGSRTPEQRARQRQERRARRALNQAGRRRAQLRSRTVKHGPPAPGYFSMAWQRAAERYLHRYGWPLPPNWHAAPRPRMPRLNAGGDHRHQVAMLVARRAANNPHLPHHYRQARLGKALLLELEAYSVASTKQRPHLLRSAAHLAATAGWADQARAIRRQATEKFPGIAGKLARPSPEAMDFYEGERLGREDAEIAGILRAIAFGTSTAGTEEWERFSAAARAILRDNSFTATGKMPEHLNASYYADNAPSRLRQKLALAAMAISRRRQRWTGNAELRRATEKLLTNPQDRKENEP